MIPSVLENNQHSPNTLNQSIINTNEVNSSQQSEEKQTPTQQPHCLHETKSTDTDNQDNDTDSEAAPLLIPSRISYLKKLSHTPPKYQQSTQLMHDTEPAKKRQYAPPHNHKTQTNNEVQSCTQCNVQHQFNDLWKCKNKFQCHKVLCLNCLIQNGYNKYYMMNCHQHWYCNECLEENMQKRHEYEQKHRHQHQHNHKKKGYNIVKFQNKLSCRLGNKCYASSSTYVTQRNFQKHCIENGWYHHQHLLIWQYWKIRPCLYCLNKYSAFQDSSKYKKCATNTFTASDVAWIPMNHNQNLCQRCIAETQNDPNKSFEKLEKENRWNDSLINLTTMDKISQEEETYNHISDLLNKDTLRQTQGIQDELLPTLLEVESITIQQVEKIPIAMLGRSKFIMNQILYNINNAVHSDITMQHKYVLQLKMVWKIITQERVRSYSTYDGYLERSDMDYKLKLLAGKWRSM